MDPEGTDSRYQHLLLALTTLCAREILGKIESGRKEEESRVSQLLASYLFLDSPQGAYTLCRSIKRVYT